jgi:aspartyl-tRNA(Asn)/glutamyl-tRNA(Gln) amidotransferase subunit C
MQLDDKEIDELAFLARLEFRPEEKKQIHSDLNRILEFCDKLRELDTEGVEPLVYMSDSVNRLREDKVEISISKEEALRNAPVKDSDYFKVPKVLKKKK